MSASQAPFLNIPFLERDIDIEKRPDGVLAFAKRAGIDHRATEPVSVLVASDAEWRSVL